MKVRFISFLDMFQAVKILFSSKHYDEIYYFDITRPGKIIVDLFNLTPRVKPIIFKMDEVRHPSGESRLPGIIGEDLNNVCRDIEDKLLRKSRLLDGFGKQFETDNILLYFRKYFRREIKDIVIFVNVIDWYCRKLPGLLGNAPVFSVERKYSTGVLKDFAGKKYCIFIDSYCSLRMIHSYFFKLFGNLYLNAALCVQSFLNYFNEHRDGELRKEGAIIATYYSLAGVTFDRSRRCDFFWLLNSSIPHDKVLVYFERKDAPVDQRMLDTLSENGVRCMAMSPGASAADKTPVYKPTAGLLKMLSGLTFGVLKELFSFRFGNAVYLPGLLHFVREYAKAYDFYRTEGIKIVVDSTDFGIQHIPRHLALEALGGVSVSYQRVNMPIPQMFVGSTADIFFTFGPHYYSTILKNESRNKVVVTSGFITDYAFSEVKGQSAELREQLTDQGAEFVIAYFDENSSDDRLSVIPNKKSEDIYRQLFEWVLTDNAIGLICSPKRPSTLHKRLAGITGIMDKALATGRCTVMEGKYLADNYPVEVAQASDIVISLLIGGTVSLESALSDKRVVYLDMEGLYSFNEYTWGKGTVLFEDFQSLKEAVNRYRISPDKYDDIGNMSINPVLDQKDPFRDGRAAERIGQYIHWLLEAFEEGKTREEAIQYAGGQYAEMWGSEHVITDLRGIA